MFPGIAGTPQGSVLVMTDADWAGDVKDRRSYTGIAVWVKGSAENIWYPVYASSKKQNMVCLSSGESELMAFGPVELARVSQQETNGARCASVLLVLLSCARTAQQRWASVKRKGCKSTALVTVDTKIYFMQALGNGTWTAHLEGAW